MAKIVGIACIRNEEDIIELSVRHNCNLLDEYHIVNNLSCDNTKLILETLKEEGLPLRIYDCDLPSHPQDTVTNHLHLKLSKEDPTIDYFVLLDGDEFIEATSKESFEQDLLTIQPGTVGAMKWKTYVPHCDVNNALEDIIYHRKEESANPCIKIIITKEFFQKVTVNIGNHHANGSDTLPKPTTMLKTRLAHFPIRSKDQFIRKIILGSHGLKMAKADWLYHWNSHAAIIRQLDYNLPDDVFKEMTLNYATNTVCDQTLVESKFKTFDNVKQTAKYKSSMLSYFDKFITTLYD